MAELPGRGPQQVDRHLHSARVTRKREQVRFVEETADLPDGVFVQVAEADHCPMMIWKERLWHLSLTDGKYLEAGSLPKRATVLTPRPMVEVLANGYLPFVDSAHFHKL